MEIYATLLLIFENGINFGQIGNFKKSNFSLQEAVNKRILLWNEPHFEPEFFVTFKLLFGGDTLNVKVKYLDDANVSRTPTIILSNSDCFPKDIEFRTRMVIYIWKECNELKKFKLKPLPSAFFLLLQNYNIINEKS